MFTNSNFREVGLKFGCQLQFRCDLEQNTLRDLTLTSEVNLWKYTRMEMCNTIRRSREVETEHSNTVATKYPRQTFQESISQLSNVESEISRQPKMLDEHCRPLLSEFF
jgi:hypothetical protein